MSRIHDLQCLMELSELSVMSREFVSFEVKLIELPTCQQLIVQHEMLQVRRRDLPWVPWNFPTDLWRICEGSDLSLEPLAVERKNTLYSTYLKVSVEICGGIMFLCEKQE